MQMGGIGKFFGGIKGIAVAIFKRKWLLGVVAIILSVLSSVWDSIAQLSILPFAAAFGRAFFSFNFSIIEKVNHFIATDYAISLGYFWALFEFFLGFSAVYLVVWIAYKALKRGATGDSSVTLNVLVLSIIIISLFHVIFILAAKPPMALASSEDCWAGISIPCEAYQFFPFSGPVYAFRHAGEILRPFGLAGAADAINQTFPIHSNITLPEAQGGEITFLNETQSQTQNESQSQSTDGTLNESQTAPAERGG